MLDSKGGGRSWQLRSKKILRSRFSVWNRPVKACLLSLFWSMSWSIVCIDIVSTKKRAHKGQERVTSSNLRKGVQNRSNTWFISVNNPSDLNRGRHLLKIE